MDFAGVDPITGPIPIQPGQHYSMGGIDVDIDGRTALPGLYAAGEYACVSVHGANRLGGNSLLETVVFGRLVAGAIIKEIPPVARPGQAAVREAVLKAEAKIAGILAQAGGGALFPLIDSLKATMWEKFGIFRTGDAMAEGLDLIRQLRDRFGRVSFSNRDRVANQALVRYLEAECMLAVAETVAVGALERKESRGSHYRPDYPTRDDRNFLRHTLIRTDEEGNISLEYSPVVTGMFEPEERVY